MISQAQLCNLNKDDCASQDSFEEITLPHIDDIPTFEASRDWLYKLSYTAASPGETLQAIYLPKFSETLQIRINGIIIEDMPDFALTQSRRWSRPEIYILPQNILTGGVNRIEIDLAGYKSLRTDLFPVYIGPVSYTHLTLPTIYSV